MRLRGGKAQFSQEEDCRTSTEGRLPSHHFCNGLLQLQQTDGFQEVDERKGHHFITTEEAIQNSVHAADQGGYRRAAYIRVHQGSPCPVPRLASEVRMFRSALFGNCSLLDPL